MVDIIANPIVLPNYANVLAEPRPKKFSLSRRPLMIAGFFLLCLLPRAVIAVKCPSLGPDAPVYIDLAKSIGDGNLQSNYSGLQLNVFTVILTGLHRLGLDWETAGRWWGVFIAALAVLPLFGWIRRQFDDRVALAACFLYAVHPCFIEWSPRIVRDPTFWFFFSMSLYLLWRAVCEVRPMMFAIAGLVSILAVMTRTEGIFLIVPFVLWSVWRYLALGCARKRLLAGVLAYVLVAPAILLLVNATFLQKYSTWKLCSLPASILMQKWNRTFDGCGEEASANGAHPDHATSKVGAEHIEKMSFGKMSYKFALLMENGITAIFGLLLLGGLWNWRKIWARRDNQPLFYVSLVIMAGIWMDYWHGGQTSTRYPLTIALMAMPFAGLALLGISQWLFSLTKRFNMNVRWQRIAIFTPAIIVAAASFPEALYSSSRRYDTLQTYASVGRWLQGKLDADSIILGHEAVARISQYQTGINAIEINVMDGPGYIARMAALQNVDAVLLSKNKLKSFDETKLFRELEKMGYEKVLPANMPPEKGIVNVFLRKPDRKTTTSEKGI